MYVCMLAR